MKQCNVVIIGAPRSGTNMLRDVLVSFDGIGTWPCDEINYIWRHGNLCYPSDEIPESRATRSVISYVRKSFISIRDKQKIDIVVEKTCANSLRVPFVDRIVPEARYIYIYRDGIDVVGSSRLRWTAGLDIPYLLRKVRYVPVIDLPFYALRYFWHRIYRLFSSERRLAFWGPRLNGMQQLLTRYSLNEVCAIQWQRCVDEAEKAFSVMPNDRVLRVRYEDFVKHPSDELKRILSFIEYHTSESDLMKAVEDVSAKNLGKGRQLLGEGEVLALEKLIGESLRRYGYL